MNLLESVGAGARDMASHKGRAVITIIGIVLGTASVVAVLSLMRGGEKQTEDFFDEMGGLRELRITNTRSHTLFETAAERASERLTYRDAQAIRRECPSVLTVDPEITRADLDGLRRRLRHASGTPGHSSGAGLPGNHDQAVLEQDLRRGGLPRMALPLVLLGHQWLKQQWDQAQRS